jgi:hypothetical protein
MAVQREKKSYPFKAVVQPRPQTLGATPDRPRANAGNALRVGINALQRQVRARRLPLQC